MFARNDFVVVLHQGQRIPAVIKGFG
ncbi:hypothetical protein LCGC14_2602630, partial [marine sediment metagenome]